MVFESKITTCFWCFKGVSIGGKYSKIYIVISTHSWNEYTRFPILFKTFYPLPYVLIPLLPVISGMVLETPTRKGLVVAIR